MTKEEYERLLQSDYWKGYSYSLIKERNYTCEDCGRSFPNERNRLQVHHLVYRDVNPWSYRPEEVVVLCEECHKRRHGLLTEPEPKPELRAESEPVNQSQTTSYDRSEGKYNHDDGHGQNDPFTNESMGRKKIIALGAALVALLLVAFLHGKGDTDFRYPYDEEVYEEAPVPETKESSSASQPRARSAGTKSGTAKSVARPAAKDDLPVGLEPIPEIKAEAEELTKVELAAEKALDPAKPESAGTQREKSTLEILEERNHANAVEQARRAGVSTEGSTLEILERINHANAVEQGKRAGVSTEGSTLDILERINHANAVEQARRAGVSTEGTTLEILERINRKNLEKYSY